MPAMKRSVTVSVGGFARRALAAGAGDDAEHLESRAVRAIRTYLSDKEVGRAGWKIPALAGSAEPTERVELSFSLDDDLWAAVENEAVIQGVSTDRLVGQAILYWAAEIDAGRIAQRIVRGLEAEEDE